MKQVHAKAQSRKFEKRNKKSIFLVFRFGKLSVPAGALPGWNFQNIPLVFWCIGCPAVFCFPVTELRALASLGGYEGVR